MYPWEHTETQKTQAAPIGLAQPLADSMPAEDVLPPPAPANSAVRIFRGQAALMWQASERADGYLVLRGESPAQLKPIAAIEETSYMDAAAKPGKQYFYAVRAYNGHGQSSAAQTAGIVLPERSECPVKENDKPREPPFTGKRLRVNRSQAERIEIKKHSEKPAEDVHEKKDAPPAPKELHAAARGTRLAALTWQAGADAADTEYRIYRSAAPWCGYGLVAETKETSFLDTVPEAVTKHYYFVQAVRGGQASEPSAMAEVFTFPPLPPPEPPQNLRAIPAENAVELQWKHGKAAAAYVIYARVEGEEFKVAGYTLEHSFLHEAPADTPMEYRVQSYHDTGVSEPTGICAMRARRPQQQRPPSLPRFPAFNLGNRG